MNINQKNWSIMDFIDSFASLGNQDYIRFKALSTMYPYLSLRLIHDIEGDVFGGAFNVSVKNGMLKCSEQQFEDTSKTLEILSDYIPAANKVEGKKDYLLRAIAFAINHSDVDSSILLKHFLSLYSTIPPIATLEVALNELSRIYNRGLKQRKVNLYADYLNRETVAKSRWHKGEITK